MLKTATAIAPANIAFIKYWGKKDPALNIPFNDSLSMNLSDALTTTTVTFDDSLSTDTATLNNEIVSGSALQKIVTHLDLVRGLGKSKLFAHVDSSNSFPTASGIASSASGFAALSLAATSALGLKLSEVELSKLARRGSGSASRSLGDGFVEWHKGTGDDDSFAESFAPASHWDLLDLVIVVDAGTKKKSSGEGHDIATTSPFYKQRQLNLPVRTAAVKQAILDRNLLALGPLIEAEAIEMHSTTFTATPPMTYWNGGTIEVIRTLFELREQNIHGYFTIDAGANVHVITTQEYRSALEEKLRSLPEVVKILINHPGHGARLVSEAK